MAAHESARTTGLYALLGYKLSDPDPLDLIERDIIVAPVVTDGLLNWV
jgi:hypothetical protein